MSLTLPGTRRSHPSALLAALVGIAGLACERADPDRRSDLLLLTLDTTRADALGSYGKAAAATPNLDRLAAEGILFAQAITTAPYTGPSHASMLTGLFPPRHGLRDFLKQRLTEDQVTLAELLRGAGYETAAFVSAYPLQRHYGLAQGFERYSASRWDGGNRADPSPFFERRAEDTIAETLDWLTRREGDRPFFAWVHLYDPHAPYRPPTGFRPPTPPLGPDASAAERTRWGYQAEVAYMDAQIGRLLGGLADLALFEQLAILVVADHGELMGYHGRRLGGHSPSLADATVRVPLLLRAPGRPKGRREEKQVRVVDVFPTILELASLPIPASIDGKSLLHHDPNEDRIAYSETFYANYPDRATEGSELRSLRQNPWKLVMGPWGHALYHLGEDPAEARDVAADHPEVVAQLLSRLEELTERWPADSQPASLDLSDEQWDDHVERLRALGYLQ